MSGIMSKLKLHVVSRPEFIATNFADFQGH